MLKHILDIRIPSNKPDEFDYADVHLESGRVFVAHTVAGTVEVLDGEERNHLKTIGGCPEGSEVLCARKKVWSSRLQGRRGGSLLSTQTPWGC
ncbi:MAG: hypothetical protein QW767_01960 [Thermoprotei archaeon]